MTGLPLGAGWGISIDARNETTTNSNLSFYLPAESYGFVVLKPNGTTAVPGSGTVNTLDENATVLITFFVNGIAPPNYGPPETMDSFPLGWILLAALSAVVVLAVVAMAVRSRTPPPDAVVHPPVGHPRR